MAVPSQQTFLRPVLQITADSEGGLPYREILEEAVPMLALTEEDLQERTSRGVLRVESRIRFSLSMLKKAELLDVPTRGHYQATESGRRRLQQHTEALSAAELNMLAAGRKHREDTPPDAGFVSVDGDISPYSSSSWPTSNCKTGWLTNCWTASKPYRRNALRIW